MPKHLLFDFGAVLIPIDTKLTYKAFEALGAEEKLAEQDELFHQYERGELSTDEFLSQLQGFFFRKSIFKKDLAEAWNALCYEAIPDDNIRLLKNLKNKGHKLYLLSNTNPLHIEKIKALCGPFKYKQFISQFDAVYYSHQTGHRKPEADFYKKVLKEQKLKAADCFFIDDREDNIEAATKLKLECWHFDPKKDKIETIKKRL